MGLCCCGTILTGPGFCFCVFMSVRLGTTLACLSCNWCPHCVFVFGANSLHRDEDLRQEQLFPLFISAAGGSLQTSHRCILTQQPTILQCSPGTSVLLQRESMTNDSLIRSLSMRKLIISVIRSPASNRRFLLKKTCLVFPTRSGGTGTSTEDH